MNSAIQTEREAGTSQVAIDDQYFRASLGQHKRRIDSGRGLSFRRLTRRNQNRPGRLPGRRQQQRRTQVPVRLRDRRSHIVDHR